MRSTTTAQASTSENDGDRLTDRAAIRISHAITNHPRFNALFTDLDGLYAWIDRAEARYLSEIDRVGPTKARQQVRRIVNEVALIGNATA